ncbi:MAG: ABC transporter substrate-binding protein [Deltaproteobacteria bacterium]|nr:ABC transporter substrate-binding protein [Deltaproteobacteria bacterium]
MKKSLLFLIASVFLFNAISMANAGEKLMVYTSMKESLIGSLRDAFVKKHPDIAFDYYSAGAGKLMAKIAAERQSGKLTVDVLWHSEVPDFYKLKQDGLLEQYVSPEAKYVESPVKDPDSYFTPARLGTLGIAYNTKKVTIPPKDWEDLLDPRFKGGFGIANPALSGTSFVSVAMMVNTMGWEYFEKLAKNGAIMGQGSGQVVDDTASGDLLATLAVDYITIDKIKKGAYLGFVFPNKMLVVPSPIAIMKGTENRKAAEKFIDFLLSKEGQTLIAASGTLPIRTDVVVSTDMGLIPADQAVERAMKLDYIKTMNEKEEIIKKFTSILREKN